MSDAVAVEKRTGVYKPTGETVSFKIVWGGHKFTEEEQEALLRGDEIRFSYVTGKGNNAEAAGVLAEQEYNGHSYWGFKKKDTIPSSWCGHQFTDEEIAALENGLVVEASDFMSKKTGKTFATKVTWEEDATGTMRITPHFESR